MNTPTSLFEFAPYGKTPRLFREVVVTEKIDGTNAQICIDETGQVRAGSRTRWVTPQEDNYGFAAWVSEHKTELLQLGPGRHFGEWYGRGINRGYGMPDRRFALFNVSRWEDGALSPVKYERGVAQPRVALSPRPACCEVVPVLYRGPFCEESIKGCALVLQGAGSVAAPGFMRPEGIVVFHTAANQVFKVLLENDQSPKGEA